MPVAGRPGFDRIDDRGYVAEFVRMDWFMRARLLPWLISRVGFKPVMDIQAHVLVADRVHTAIYGKLIMIGPDGVLGPEAAEELLAEFVTEPLVVEDWRVVG